ncbi:DGQHR domain-containing protein [Mariniluteicoccus flavus]
MPSGLDESKLLSELSNIKREATRRGNPFTTVSVDPKLQSDYEDQGWTFDRKMKRSVRLKRPKSTDVMLEDRVWRLLAGLGFQRMNRGRDFYLPYGNGASDRKQIDVFAMDEETILVVECKSAQKQQSTALKQEIESWIGIRPGLMATLRKEFPKHKIKIVVATVNLILRDTASDRLRNAAIFHLDERLLEYFEGLLQHLGEAARYQLLGTIFAGEKIENLESRIPAIRGKMGGHTYYSFMVEPQRLLKLTYVLHNTLTLGEDLGTYQRLVRRTRLGQIKKFVDTGGYFPNSIIINIDPGRKDLQFDNAAVSVKSPQVGVLHLPPVYRTAYVIDGQHRLYGYSGSSRADSELVPVVAFVGLDPADQVQMFMDINENQKAVSKTLRNILDSDLLWGSSNLAKRAKSVRLKIAQRLADSQNSVLSGRVLLGEEARTDDRCISIEAIQSGLSRGSLLGTYTATKMTSAGSLDQGDGSETVKHVFRFLEQYFAFLAEHCEDQYQLASRQGGFLFMNNGVEALIRLASDFVEHVSRATDVRTVPVAALMNEIEPLLLALVDCVNGLSADLVQELRTAYGAGGKTRFLRILQHGVSERFPDFLPAGMAEYFEEQDDSLSTQAYVLLSKLEGHLKIDFRKRLDEAYGDFKKGLPQQVFLDASGRVAQKEFAGETVDFWDCLYLIDYQKIARKSAQQWKLFESDYTLPGEEKLKWESRSSWIDKVNSIRNKTMHNQDVTLEEHDYLVQVVAHIVK